MQEGTTSLYHFIKPMKTPLEQLNILCAQLFLLLKRFEFIFYLSRIPQVSFFYLTQPDGASPLGEILRTKRLFRAALSTPWKRSGDLRKEGWPTDQGAKCWWPRIQRGLEETNGSWTGFSHCYRPPPIRCCQLGHSYLSSTFTPKVRVERKRTRGDQSSG